MTSDAGLRDSLRLAAKAADREKAAERLWPAFEKRLEELGYGPGAIMHAFTKLTGPATVAETLDELAQTARRERGRVVALRYTIRPPLAGQATGPRAEGRDDCGNTYQDIGGLEGLAGPLCQDDPRTNCGSPSEFDRRSE